MVSTQESLLVTGASGFIGSRLSRSLVEAGHRVRAMTRRPEDYTGAGEPIGADVHDRESLAPALDDIGTAYYLVHSLTSPDFERLDAQAARTFAAAAAEAGVRRIVYLGGLGSDDGQLSPHLRSRRAVESLLGSTGVPVTALRAAVVIGHGGISWEITRQLVDHLPAMLVPSWVGTRSQPIALADVIGYLVGVLDDPATGSVVYEIGGREVLSYQQMLQRAARIQNHRSLPIVTVPLLTPRLSSAWLALVTDVDLATARNLVDSMITEVVVRDHSVRDVVPLTPMGYDDAVRAALAERAAVS